MKPTLTIGVPAYNEEANIKNLLNRLLRQQQTNFELLEIIVMSDGSSDATVKKASEVEDPKIKVIDSTDRKGKIKRINEIFEIAKGDIVALVDADVIPATYDTFDNLIKPFIENSEVVYTSGGPKVVKPQNFIEQAVYVSRSVWDKVRLNLKNGNSVYSCHGQLYALKNEFAKKNPFPETVWADIGFHYFICLRDGGKFVSAKSAGTLFTLPATSNDYIKQISRYQREDKALISYFGDWILPEYVIPKSMLYKYKLQAFLRWPLHCTVIFILNFYAKYFYKESKKTAIANWTLVNSTKKQIVNDL